MEEQLIPTLRDVIAGYDRFNEWEMEERRIKLAALSIEDGLQQFFELCEFVRSFRPDGVAAERAIEHKQAGWLSVYRRLAGIEGDKKPWTLS